MTITTNATTTPLGTYSVSVKGTSGSTTQTTIYTLSVVNRIPDVPTLGPNPPNNVWINYNPTFQATVFDPDAADTVRAVFGVSGYGNVSGSLLPNNGPGTSSWGPVAIADGDWWWRALNE